MVNKRKISDICYTNPVLDSTRCLWPYVYWHTSINLSLPPKHSGGTIPFQRIDIMTCCNKGFKKWLYLMTLDLHHINPPLTSSTTIYIVGKYELILHKKKILFIFYFIHYKNKNNNNLIN